MVKSSTTNAIALNLSDPVTKRRLHGRISQLQGLWEVTLEPIRPTRSLRANHYYFVSLVGPFKEWLRDQWGDPSITNEQAHVELKKHVLGTENLVNKQTGEVLELIPDTKEMSSKEFAEYLDKAIEWLARVCGIVVLPAELFYGEQS